MSCQGTTDSGEEGQRNFDCTKFKLRQGRACFHKVAAKDFPTKLKKTSLSVKYLVAMRLWETPVYIPNTKVKPRTADDTVPATARESRWLPEQKRKNKDGVRFTGGRSIRGKQWCGCCGGRQNRGGRGCTLKTSYRCSRENLLRSEKKDI